MEKIIYHNSQEKFYRDPFGALEINSDLTLRIRTNRKTDRVTLNYWTEALGKVRKPMELLDDRGENRVFTLTFNVGADPQLLWYNFILGNDELFYGNNEDGLGGQGQIYEEDPLSYQLTIYRPSPVPAWFKESIVYQIFPDRFKKSQNQDLSACEKKDALVHLSWENDPYYIKNERGQVVRWDFFGGDLKGIVEKIDYLKELGINCLYLNPIFEARSNHRYDTGDYHKIDPMLGTNEYFKEMTRLLDEAGIKVILDGVFSHTGADSIYFNKYKNYDSQGAFNSQKSIYYNWYSFIKYPDKYESWWGVEDLPAVNEMEPGYQDFIYNNPDGVVRYWLDKGAAGWRLDVVDELPGQFIKRIKKAARESREDAVIIGEVWEDASNKVSYGKSREYLLGDELDSPTNYPLRAALLAFVKGQTSAGDFHRSIMNLYENYPPEHFYAALNMLGSHDVERIGSLLDQEEHKICLYFLMTFPGVPLVYYGDEAGLKGHKDPDNRKTYPWGCEDKELLALYKDALALRRREKIFTQGTFASGFVNDNLYYFIREAEGQKALVLINRGSKEEDFAIEDGVDFFQGKIAPKDIKIMQNYAKKKVNSESLQRSSGILCHITSLAGKEAYGTLGQATYDFIDFLERTGQKIWQILPLNQTDIHLSPYASPDGFAGNHLLIDLESLAESEILSQEDWQLLRDKDKKEYREKKEQILREIFKEWIKKPGRQEDLGLFYGQEKSWLEDHLKYYQEKKGEEDPDYLIFLQKIFMDQYLPIKEYANKKGISIFGDLPFYVNLDSREVFSSGKYFLLDQEGVPLWQGGVPPDSFQDKGQLWGMPAYNWQAIEADNFSFWLKKIRRLGQLYDYLRLDHFRGFEAVWLVAWGAEDAREGQWFKVPGDKFLASLAEENSLGIIAENLGHITPQVQELLDKYNLPGMKILQFLEEDLYLFKESENNIYYTGTHDNDTLISWLREKLALTKDLEKEIAWDFIKKVWRSRALWAIVPIQDLLFLGVEGRMNLPGTLEGNWQWTWQPDYSELEEIAGRLKDLSRESSR